MYNWVQVDIVCRRLIKQSVTNYSITIIYLSKQKQKTLSLKEIYSVSSKITEFLSLSVFCLKNLNQSAINSLF